MARFLSPEWFRAAGAVSGGSGVDAVIEHVVEGGPEDRVVYQVEMAGAEARIVWPVPDGAPEPDLRLTASWDTAVAIARGELATQRALMDGRLRVKGRPGRLADVVGPLAGRDPLPPAVRESTTFDAAP